MSWDLANRRLIANALGELSYEGLLRPERMEPTPESTPGTYRLATPHGVVYEFIAWRTVWDHLRVTPASVRRLPSAGDEPTAARFFLDVRDALGMNDIILANFFEEMHNTLYSEAALIEKHRGVSARDLAEGPLGRVQSFLSGHPKLLLNKGRMGWGASDLEAYSPESEADIRLHWLAIREDLSRAGFAPGTDTRTLLAESCDSEETSRLLSAARALGADKGFHFVPVHPWQWDRFLRIQFAAAAARGDLVSLGVFGDTYRAQISLRTLSNVSRPGKTDIKLPLTLLNTSAYRGIPPKFIDIAPALARSVSALCRADEELLHTDVLAEIGGVCLPHESFAEIKDAPYRYHEMLGALWRESAESKLSAGEDAVMTGALFHQDGEGRSFLGSLVRRSGLAMEDWLALYFDRVVVPLYHLQVKHGVGLVAHGQNIVVKLKDHRPCGLLVKDFQGDLRLSSEETAFTRRLGPLAGRLTRLPPAHLIHDLLTGHFVTVLRFVSGSLEESEGFPERKFYGLLADRVQAYVDRHPELPTGGAMSLLNPTIPRVVLNKVRFKIGYGDSAERPLPLLAEDLSNPLCPSNRDGEVKHV